jgi:hypothetical protein
MCECKIATFLRNANVSPNPQPKIYGQRTKRKNLWRSRANHNRTVQLVIWLEISRYVARTTTSKSSGAKQTRIESAA